MAARQDWADAVDFRCDANGGRGAADSGPAVGGGAHHGPAVTLVWAALVYAWLLWWAILVLAVPVVALV